MLSGRRPTTNKEIKSDLATFGNNFVGMPVEHSHTWWNPLAWGLPVRRPMLRNLFGSKKITLLVKITVINLRSSYICRLIFDLHTFCRSRDWKGGLGLEGGKQLLIISTFHNHHACVGIILSTEWHVELHVSPITSIPLARLRLSTDQWEQGKWGQSWWAKNATLRGHNGLVKMSNFKNKECGLEGW